LLVAPTEKRRPLFELGDKERNTKTTDLPAAYLEVGQIKDKGYQIPKNWDMYLDMLHGVPAYDSDGLDAYDLIVKARGDALVKNLPMWTKPHIPCEGDPARVIITEQEMDLGNQGDPQVYKFFSVPYTAVGFGWDPRKYRKTDKT
jgi:hypothetical protein